jgi:hypothetical protein
MPFNLVGFTEATPGTGTVNVAPGGNEQHYFTSGDNLKVTPEAPYVLGVLYSAESTGARAILRQAKMIDYDIIKGCLTADVDTIQGWTHLFGRPLPLRVDNLQALSVNGTDEDTIIGVMLGSGKIRQSDLDAVNPTHVITGYGDTTITANSWTHCPITWNETLDAGTYEVVGMRASVFLAANPWTALARLVIPGATNWRPGVPCAIAEADHEEYQSITREPWKDFPLMGVQFDVDHMPNIEVLSPA